MSCKRLRLSFNDRDDVMLKNISVLPVISKDPVNA